MIGRVWLTNGCGLEKFAFRLWRSGFNRNSRLELGAIGKHN